MTNQRIQSLKYKIQKSRKRLINVCPDFSETLNELIYVATDNVKRISTNGRCIYFDPNWFQKLDDVATDFILAHQVLHILLGHIERPNYYKGDRFHLACDIVANSHLYMLGWQYDKIKGIGRIFYETFYPQEIGRKLSAQEAKDYIPFDPATMSPAIRRNYMIDSEQWWDFKSDNGSSGIIVLRPGEKDPDDIEIENTTGGTHIFLKRELFIEEPKDEEIGIKEKDKGKLTPEGLKNKLQELRGIKKRSMGVAEDYLERAWTRTTSEQLDWRKILTLFIQEDIHDYSFSPPDKRFHETNFFLPDYNESNEKIKNVLFMVDTSASVQAEELAIVFAELVSLISQFGGKLEGLLGFFDSKVYPPKPFSTIDNLNMIKALGGGGTDYFCIFDYIVKKMDNEKLSSIVIFTDGDAEFPPVPTTNGIPVLWLFTRVDASAPWGKVAYIKQK